MASLDSERGVKKAPELLPECYTGRGEGQGCEQAPFMQWYSARAS